MDYSILMSVYIKDNPSYLKIAIESMLNQTVKSNDFIIVCDGPLTSDLNRILDQYSTNQAIKIIRKEKNTGLGNSLNIGLSHCKYNFVARMDSDDFSLPERCEKQLAILKKEDFDIVGSAVDEYDINMKTLLSRRIPPQNHVDIVNFSKSRSPFNHPSVMFRKDAILEVGNYQSFRLHEDYYLWIRLLKNGFKGYNIQESLLKMRTDIDMILRRGGYNYYKSGKQLQKYMLKVKYINVFRYLFNLTTRFIFQVLFTPKTRKYFYLKTLRKK